MAERSPKDALPCSRPRTRRCRSEACGTILSLALSADGKHIASGAMDKTIKLWDAASGKEVKALPNQKGRIWAVAFSPDGKTLATSACEPLQEGEVRLWDLGKVLK